MQQTSAVEVDRNGLEVLDRSECLRLLATAAVGRVGTSAGALPVVLPVPYRIIDDEVIFQAGRGTTVGLGIIGTVVAFEVDDVDPLLDEGWTVVVTGVARRFGLPEEWADDDGVTVAVPSAVVNGRRILPR